MHYWNSTNSPLSIQPTLIREFNDIQLFSSNSTYGAQSNYAFVFSNLGKIPVQYLRVRIPDCFKIDSTMTLVKVAKITGAVEYTEIYQINTHEFWFNCNCTNFTITQLYNSGSDNATCSQMNKYFKLYNYQDG